MVQLPVYVISGADTGIVALVGTGIKVVVVVVAVERPEGLPPVMKLVVGDSGDRGVDVPVVRVVDPERVALPVVGVIVTERDEVELDTAVDVDELDGNTEGPTIDVLVEIVPDEEEPIVLREDTGEVVEDREGGEAGVVADVGIVGTETVVTGGGAAGVVAGGGAAGVVAGGGAGGGAAGVVAGGGPPVEVPWRAASCIITGASHVGTP